MRGALVLPAALVVACSDASAGPSAMARDSAGVQIIESTAPAWTAADAWMLADAPSLEIGVVDGDDVREFQEITDVQRLSDGSIVVANGGSGEIRIFTSTGEYRSTLGRSGGGPGEFEGLGRLLVTPGDTIIAFDYLLRRITVFVNGTMVASTPLDGIGNAPLRLAGRMSDGSFVFGAGFATADLPREKRTVGVHRSNIPLVRYSSAGSPLDTIGWFPGMEMGVAMRDGVTQMGQPFYGRDLSIVTDGANVYVGDQQEYAIRRFGTDDALQRIVRLPLADLTISADELDAIKQRMRVRAAGLPNLEEEIARHFQMWPVPDRKPAHSRLLAGPDGQLWVGAAALSMYLEEPVSWDVFDGDGRWLGTVAMPDRFRLYHIGRDDVTGVWSDDSDVEHIRVYPIIRSRPD